MKTGKNPPLVYLLVLCHNSMKWLEICIASLLKTDYANYKIILIDNGSTDNSIEYVRKNYPDIFIIENKKNYGWCKGNNIGVEKAIQDKADYVVLLNSDINAEDKNWLKELITFSTENPTYKITGCTQYEYNSKGWDTLNSWTEYILFNGPRDVFFMWQQPDTKTEPFYTSQDIKKTKHLDCYFVQGAAMMVSLDVFKKIGLFDTIYYIFYDEVDFSRRARLIGYETALITKSRIKHVGAGDTSSDNKKKWKNYLMTRNKYIFLLSDISKTPNRFFIIWQLIKHDLKDSLTAHKNVSSFGQFLKVFFSLILFLPAIMYKRHKEKSLK